jgi:hypothetical protein
VFGLRDKNLKRDKKILLVFCLCFALPVSMSKL